MYHFREYADAGGLVSYGIDPADVYRQVGVYAGRLLKGAKPAELPVMQASKFEFIINLRTAKTLGLEVPLGLTAARRSDNANTRAVAARGNQACEVMRAEG
jgi:putative ABC transport system substrate-binding protein